METKTHPAPDKRQEKRLVTLAPIRIKVFKHPKEELEVFRVADISRRGLSIMTSRRLALHSTVSVNFEPPSVFATSTSCSGKVHRCEELFDDANPQSRYLCGLSLDMTAQESRHWEAFITEVLGLGAAIEDRRGGARLRNGLVFHHPAKKRASRFREPPSIQIVQLTLKDLNELEQLEIRAWGPEMCASRDMLKSRLILFPEGMIGARFHGELIGYVGTMMIKKDQLQNDFTWWDITGGGAIEGMHDPKGDCLYGVSLSVVPQAPKNVALLLLKAAGKLTIRKAVRGIFFGTRIPNYHKHHKAHSPQDYVKIKTKAGRFLDPELELYSKVDCLPIRILPGYFEDPESLNFGVLVSWLNPLYEIQMGQYPFFFDKLTVDFT